MEYKLQHVKPSKQTVQMEAINADNTTHTPQKFMPLGGGGRTKQPIKHPQANIPPQHNSILIPIRIF
jgi:hypothetical protein